MARALILLLAVAAAAARDDDEDAAWDAYSAAYSEQVYRETRAGRRLAATAGRSYRGATVVGGVVRAVTEPVVQGKRKLPPYWAALHSARPQAEPVAGTWRGLRGERVQDGDMSLLSLLFYGSTAYKHTDVEATVGNTKLKCASFSGGGGCPRAGRRLDQYRVLCGREGWHAHEAVAAGRSDASVTFGPREGCADPPTLTLRFELEALAALPAPVRSVRNSRFERPANKPFPRRWRLPRAGNSTTEDYRRAWSQSGPRSTGASLGSSAVTARRSWSTTGSSRAPPSSMTGSSWTRP